MPGGSTNCARFRKSIADAASAELSPRLRSDFDGHVRSCAGCAEEFRRVQALVQAIDEGVAASVAAEPSPALLASLRQRIASEPDRAPAWWPGRVWLAAGACAALAGILFAARTLHKPAAGLATGAAVTSARSPSRSASPAKPAPAVESALARPRRAMRLAGGHVSARTLRRMRPEPEVIVEPGQMEAILRFAAAMQRGQIDGAKLLADQKTEAEPLDVKPLAIAPLKIAALGEDSTPPSSGSSQGGDKNFAAGRSD